MVGLVMLLSVVVRLLSLVEYQVRAEAGGARRDAEGDLSRAGGPALQPAQRGVAAGGLRGRQPDRGGGGGATEQTHHPLDCSATAPARLVGSAP